MTSHSVQLSCTVYGIGKSLGLTFHSWVWSKHGGSKCCSSSTDHWRQLWEKSNSPLTSMSKSHKLGVLRFILFTFHENCERQLYTFIYEVTCMHSNCFDWQDWGNSTQILGGVFSIFWWNKPQVMSDFIFTMQNPKYNANYCFRVNLLKVTAWPSCWSPLQAPRVLHCNIV